MMEMAYSPSLVPIDLDKSSEVPETEKVEELMLVTTFIFPQGY